MTVNISNTTMELIRYSETTDVTLAVIYIICFLVGVPGNVLSFKYFVSQRKDIANCTYILITVTDMFICATTVPVIASLLHHREPLIFGNKIVCTIWGVLWKFLPYFSVSLVAALSVTRTTILVKPLSVPNKKLILLIIGLYGTYLMLRVGVPHSTAHGYFIYKSQHAF